MPDQDVTPIIIEVKDGRWDAFSLQPQPTKRDQMLLDFVRSMGGVNESVKPGRYTFNLIEVEGFNTAHLLPLEK